MPRKTARDPEDAGDAAGADDLGELDFETALAELEALVDQMETGELTLEASLGAFERGVRLTRHCQNALRGAELKVKELTKDGRLETFDPESLDDD